MNKKKEDLVLVVAGLKLLKKVLIEADNGIFAYLVIYTSPHCQDSKLLILRWYRPLVFGVVEMVG